LWGKKIGRTKSKIRSKKKQFYPVREHVRKGEKAREKDLKRVWEGKDLVQGNLAKTYWLAQLCRHRRGGIPKKSTAQKNLRGKTQGQFNVSANGGESFRRYGRSEAVEKGFPENTRNALNKH